MGNRSRDLPVCSTVPQTTAPPRTPTIHIKLDILEAMLVLDLHCKVLDIYLSKLRDIF
jgi:hypothetical protein